MRSSLSLRKGQTQPPAAVDMVKGGTVEAAALIPANESPGFRPKGSAWPTWADMGCSLTPATPGGLSMGFQGKAEGLVKAQSSDTGPRPVSTFQEELSRYCPGSDPFSHPADRLS